MPCKMVPLFLSISFFKDLHSHISLFIWNKSVPRARRAILEMPKSAGGLAFPNFMLYYWAANLSQMLYWITSFRTGQSPTWVAMETEICSSLSPLPLEAVSCSYQPEYLAMNFFQFKPITQFHFSSI